MDFRRQFALLLLCASLLYLGRIGHAALVSEEFRWGEVAREMRLNDTYLYPTINGHAYYDKPLGSYWPIVGVSFLTGEVDEAAARIPSALAALASVLILTLWTRKLFGASAALWTGIILASSFSFAFYARRASADMENLLGILVAVCYFERNRGNPSNRWVVVLWLLMAVNSLMKGLLGFAVPVLVFLFLGCWNAWSARPRTLGGLVQENRWLFNWYSLVGIPLAVALYFLPFALGPGGADGLKLVFRENIQRFYAPHNHKGPVYLYLGVIFVLAAPWSVLLPFVVWKSVGKPDKTPAERFALAWFLGTFLFFTLSASRRSYYLLPILPPLAMLTGNWLAARSWKPMFGFLALAGMAAWFLVAQPLFDDQRTRRAFAAEVAERLAGDYTSLGVHGAEEIVFELRTRFPLPEVATPADAKVRWLVVPRKHADPFLERGTVVAEERVNEWEKGDRLGNKLLLVERKE